MAVMGCIAMHASEADSLHIEQLSYTLNERLLTKVKAPFDTTRDEGYWLRALKHGKFDINDTTVIYPKFLDFCFDVYRWGDKVFNSYDSAYVKPTGKNWKVMFKTNMWFDSYYGNFHDKQMRFLLNSDMNSSLGLRLSFMAVGIEYMPDIDNLLSLDRQAHRNTRFSFTCSRIAADAYLISNEGTTHFRRFGNIGSELGVNKEFNGLKRRIMGVDVFYFFNHNKFAHAAAYCYSKYQVRSAGSFILGFQYSNQKVTTDLNDLPDEYRGLVTDPTVSHTLHYYDYAINIGYGYNWVFRPNWLFNIEFTPSIGIKHGAVDTIEGRHDMLSTNLRGRMALVYNHRSFFYGLQGSINGNWCRRSSYSLYTSISEFNLIAGYRF